MDAAEEAQDPDGGGSVEGNDAVCFTAGPEAAVIGAGTIHGYVAAGRKPPRIAAGISLGALSAAAMAKVLSAEPHDGVPRQTAQRAALREYLAFLTDRPFDVMWKEIPDPSDFFADLIPVKDASVPQHLREAAHGARRLFYLKVKLGRWLAGLGVSIRSIAALLVDYVRLREHYPLPEKLAALADAAVHGTKALAKLLFRFIASPQFVFEHQFDDRPRARRTGVAAEGLATMIQWLNLAMVAAWWGIATATPLVLSTRPHSKAALVAAASTLLALTALVVLGPRTRQAWLEWLRRHQPGGHLTAFASWVARLRQLLPEWAKYLGRELVRVTVQWAPLLSRLANCFFLLWTLWGIAVHVVELVAAISTLSTPSASTSVGRAAHSFLADILSHDQALRIWMAVTAIPALMLCRTKSRALLIERSFIPRPPRPLFGWLAYAAVLTTIVLPLPLLALIAIARPAGWQGPVVFVGVAFAAVWMSLTLSPVKQLLAKVRGRSDSSVAVAQSLSVSFLVVAYLAVVCSEDFYAHWLSKAATRSPRWLLFEASLRLILIPAFLLAALLRLPTLRTLVVEDVLRHLGFDRSLLAGFELKWKLHQLFGGRKLQEAEAGPGPAPVIVAAALQPLRRSARAASTARQLWARGGSIAEAVECALASPPLFPPSRLKDGRIEEWLTAKDIKLNKNVIGAELVVADGALIRQNPLPALFTYLKDHPELARNMEEANGPGREAIHVIHGVPIRAVPSESKAASHNIVDVGLKSLRLARRRDTQLEVRQTNFISSLELECRKENGVRRSWALFADEIAPPSDVEFRNRLAPAPHEVQRYIAIGCKQTLQRLYSGSLSQEQPISCASVRRPAAGAPGETQVPDKPGLPEICRFCDGMLARPPQESPDEAITRSLGEPTAHFTDQPHLGGAARLVFVANGGVFRGAFHIGMLGAFQIVEAQFDLIVGTSVGTLMGGALGQMQVNPRGDTLRQLVLTFLRVDERVALTRRLKTVARELGVRGRNIRLSPRQIRRMVQGGGRQDPGFAATGAPPALIDAISDLLLIPHSATRVIASRFVSGDFTGAAKALQRRLQTDSISRLDIEHALIDVTLLEGVARSLMTGDRPYSLASRQPYRRAQGGPSFYATATNLNDSSAVLLGGLGHLPGSPYDFVQAGLASSAFPAAFAPRLENMVFPGAGRPEVYFADGGMFDNLPFQHAIDILSHAQVGNPNCPGTKDKLAKPDLIIAGALDPRPENDEESVGSLRTLGAIRRRAATLQNDVKIKAFEFAARRINEQLSRVNNSSLSSPAVVKAVNAGVVSVFPQSPNHLNGTFAFCRSMGLRPERVERSIADGCFQTLRELAISSQAPREDLARQSIRSVAEAGKLKPPALRRPLGSQSQGTCPFYQVSNKDVACPFAERAASATPTDESTAGVYRACTNDSAHLQLWTDLTSRQSEQKPAEDHQGSDRRDAAEIPR